MQTLFAWLLTGFHYTTAYPWAAWLVTRSPRQDSAWLPPLVSLAVSAGGLSLVMFWQSMLGIPFSTAGITLTYAALMLPGAVLWWKSTRTLPPTPPRTQGGERWNLLALFLLLLISAAILFNAVYWPFSRADAVGIYHRYGQQMAETRAIVPLPGAGTLYEAYPILMPLQYTYAYLASGWINEYLARLTPALLSLGCLPAVYALGRMLHSAAAGWLGALLLALTPAFGTWASSGYVDLPMAFFYTLAAAFAWRMWAGGHWGDALLAGGMVGLAAWTKNAGLIGVGLLVLWLLWALAQRRIGWGQVALTLSACAFIAAPWYARNLLQANLLLPDTAWTDDAQHTLDTLLIFITRPNIYGVTGLLVLASVALSVGYAGRRWREAAADLLLLLWTVPFFGAWWLFANYDPRFVLLFWPLLCVLAAKWTLALWQRVPQTARRRLAVPLVLVALGLALLAVWESVEYKDNILRDPLMDDATKHEVVFSER